MIDEKALIHEIEKWEKGILEYTKHSTNDFENLVAQRQIEILEGVIDLIDDPTLPHWYDHHQGDE